MKVLVTGANGLLGQHLVKLLLQNDYTVIATGKGPSRLSYAGGTGYHYYEADITNEKVIHDVLFFEKPDYVVHAAAMTQVDDCEQHRDECFSVNVQATASLLLAAEAFAKFFIYISTDFVFDGESGNYMEDDPLKPLSWYGFTKVQAESLVESSEMPWAIVRTCLVYGKALPGTRSNLVNWVKTNLENGQKIQVVDDQVRTPTFVEDLASGILLVIRKKAEGIYHISGKDLLTPYRMALATAGHLELNKDLIHKADASVFSQPGKRPAKTGFNISKARVELGFEPLCFEDGLRKTFED